MLRVLSFVVLGFCLAVQAGAASRGLSVPIKASEATEAGVVEEVQLYAKSYALVIGIDEYRHWPRLSNGVKDAKLIAAALEENGFDVTLKLNLNSTELQAVFQEFFVFKGENPEARLFVWFAGHGHTQDGEGFLIPSDAPLASAGAKFRFKALSLRRFGEYVRLAKSKHAFSIFDSCFSGTIFETARSSPPPAITKVTTAPVRQFLSSGDAGQEVSDDGTFRRMFIEAISGKRRADANGDGYLTASELGLFLTDSVTNYSNRRQTPRYGKLNDPDFDRGDFVFKIASTGRIEPQMTRSPKSNTANLEAVFWQSIQHSQAPADYEDYLSQYPNGAFVRLAKRRLAELKGAQVARATPQVDIEGMDAAYVTLKAANLRAAPTTKAKKVGQLALGEGLTVTGRVKGTRWLRLAHDKGEAFIFSPLVVQIDKADLALWQSIKHSKAPSDFKSYLDRHPNGHFRDIATQRLAAVTLAKHQTARSGAPQRDTEYSLANKAEASKLVRHLLDLRNRAKDPGFRPDWLIDALARLGNVDEAISRAHKLLSAEVNAYTKSDLNLAVVSALASAGRDSEALKTVAAFSDPMLRYRGYRTLAYHHRARGDTEAALDSAQRAWDALAQSKKATFGYWVELTDTFAMLGDRKTTANLLKKVEAVATAEVEPEKRYHVWSLVASGMARAGEIETAFRYHRRIDGPRERSDTSSYTIAEAYARQGKISEALDLVRPIVYPFYKVVGFRKISRVLLERDQRERAREILDESFATLGKDLLARQEQTAGFAEIGAFRRALSIIDTFADSENYDYLVDSLGKLAVEQIKHGQIDDARKSIQRALRAKRGNFSYPLQEALVRISDVKTILALARNSSSGNYIAHFGHMIAEYLAPAPKIAKR